MAEESSGINRHQDILLEANFCPLASCKFTNQNNAALTLHYLSDLHHTNIIHESRKVSSRPSKRKAFRDPTAGSTLTFEAEERLSCHCTDVELVRERLDDLYINLDLLKKEMSRVRNRLARLDNESRRERLLSNALQDNGICLSQEVTSVKQRYAEVGQVTKQHQPNGVAVWRIAGVREKICDAQSERQTSVYSPPFYTSTSGYKLCVRLYLNGDGAARGSFASIFLVILRGRFDAILAWPFKFRVSFCLMDQRTIMKSNGQGEPQHLIQSFRPDESSISFRRPDTEMNVASGIPRFVSLSVLEANPETNLYVVNDTMFIKTWVDFIGVPREILPFIFSLDAGLPPHIQEKLIDEELKRRANDTKDQ